MKPAGGWGTTPRGLTARLAQGRLALSFLAPGLLRVRFTPDPEFAPRRSWAVALPDEAFEPQEVGIRPEGAALRVESGPLRVRLDLASGTLRFRDDQGREFASDLAPPRWSEATRKDLGFFASPGDELPPGRARRLVTLDKGMHPDEGYFGFGQRALGLDRRGDRVSNWNVDAAFGHNRSQDNLYQSHPVFLALRPGFAWGLFLHSTWFSRFDLGCRTPGTLELATLGGELDYYLLHGPDPAGVVEKLTRLTGRPFLPPLWSLGYHQSRWGYGSAAEVEELVAEFRERRLPLDVLHLDIDHMRGHRVFTWDPGRFPEPGALLEKLRGQGVRVVTIVDPGVKHEPGRGYAVADDMLARGMFCRERTGAPFVGFCWPDAALFPDFARARVREWWGDQHARLLDDGVAGIWQDMNEPSVFSGPFSEGSAGHTLMPLGLMHGDEAESAPHAEVHNLYGSLMCRATRAGLERLRPGERPWSLTRSAFTGVQALSCTWMGDNSSWWEHLELSLPQLASMGLSGVPHCGVDIGGFAGQCSAELYVRWMQAAVFYPFMRTHSAWDSSRQEPWAFGPEVEALAARALRLRYRLLPYLYTLAHRAHRTGEPILRPMLYDFPADAEALRRHDQVMFGPQLLVAPIVHKGQTWRLVWLPEGPWHDFWTGERHQGPRALAVHAPLERIPLFVRGGSVLPLGNERTCTGEPLTELTLEVFPGAGGEWTLVEDDGLSPGADVAETRAEVRPGPEVEVIVHERTGPWTPAPRRLQVRLHLPERPREVLVDGRGGGWTWDGRAAAVAWPDQGQARRVVAR